MNPIKLDPLSHATAINCGMRLIWAVRYKDGSTFCQFSGGVEHSTEEVDRENVASLSLLDGRGRTVITQEFKPGQIMVYRRRTAMRPGFNVLEIIHVLGWRQPLGEEEARHICFVYESDFHVEMGDFRQPGECQRPEEWRHPIAYLPSESIPVK